MASKNGKNTVFILTREDVVQMLEQLHPDIDAEKAVDADFLARIKKGIEFGLECWGDVMKTAIEETLPNTHRQSRLKLS